MDYKQIFTDSIRHADGHTFMRITIFAPDKFGAPFLIETKTGDNRCEDWDIKWELFEVKGGEREALAIRKAIGMLDTQETKWIEEIVKC